KDMGLKTKLTRWPHEFLKPINPKDYHKLLQREKALLPRIPSESVLNRKKRVAQAEYV
ncbi:MAG: hypothetical protein H7Y27_16935, partial [Gemmatimonadaceae bacterium]|nr:hypothetical protein [Chitinophagaceae bacterium]